MLLECLKKIMPVFSWLPQYHVKANLPIDFVSGISFTFLAIPEALALGALSGLNPVYGLYAFFTPIVVYFICGHSKNLSIGAITTVSIMLKQFTENINSANTLKLDETNRLNTILCITLTTGIVQISLYFLKLGKVAKLINPSLLKGFINCVALYIITGQLTAFTGIKINKKKVPFSLIRNWAEYIFNLNNIHYPTLYLGVFSLLVILASKHYDKLNYRFCKFQKVLVEDTDSSLPLLYNNHKSKKKSSFKVEMNFKMISILLTVILSSLVVYSYQLDVIYGIKVIGDVKAGVPSFIKPNLLLFDIRQCLLIFFYSLNLALLTFFITVSVSSTFTTKNFTDKEICTVETHNDQLNSFSTICFDRNSGNQEQQELFALSLSNIFGSFFMSCVSCGSLTRTALLNESGARSQIALLISLVVISINLQYLTNIYYYISEPTLAAIILSACIKLIFTNNELLVYLKDRYIEGRHTNFNKSLYGWIAGFIITFIYGLEIGLIIIVLLSLVLCYYQNIKFNK